MELFHALGLNLPALLFNAAAFLVFAWLLGKFVFPTLTRVIDAKREELVVTSQLRHEAEAGLAAAAASGEKVLAAARSKADAAIASAQAEAGNLIMQARDKAEDESKRIIDNAQAQLQHDIAAARATLKGELARLVAAETEALLGHKLSAGIDAKLIVAQLESSK